MVFAGVVTMFFFHLFVFIPVKPAVYAAAVIPDYLPMMRAAKVTTVLKYSSCYREFPLPDLKKDLNLKPDREENVGKSPVAVRCQKLSK